MLVFVAVPIPEEDLIKWQRFYADWTEFANRFIAYFAAQPDPNQFIMKMFRRIRQIFDLLRTCTTVVDYVAIYPRVQASIWRMNEFIRSGPFPV